jgi:hypothetical protein
VRLKSIHTQESTHATPHRKLTDTLVKRAHVEKVEEEVEKEGDEEEDQEEAEEEEEEEEEGHTNVSEATPATSGSRL